MKITKYFGLLLLMSSNLLFSASGLQVEVENKAAEIQKDDDDSLFGMVGNEGFVGNCGSSFTCIGFCNAKADKKEIQEFYEKNLCDKSGNELMLATLNASFDKLNNMTAIIWENKICVVNGTGHCIRVSKGVVSDISGEYRIQEIGNDDDFMVMASMNFWEVFSRDEVVEFIYKSLEENKGNYRQTTEALMDMVRARGVVEDINIIILNLKLFYDDYMEISSEQADHTFKDDKEEKEFEYKENFVVGVVGDNFFYGLQGSFMGFSKRNGVQENIKNIYDKNNEAFKKGADISGLLKQEFCKPELDHTAVIFGDDGKLYLKNATNCIIVSNFGRQIEDFTGHIVQYKRSASNDFLLMASDNVWAVLSETDIKAIYSILAENGDNYKRTAVALQLLVKSRNVQGDINIVIINLRKLYESNLQNSSSCRSDSSDEDGSGSEQEADDNGDGPLEIVLPRAGSAISGLELRLDDESAGGGEGSGIGVALPVDSPAHASDNSRAVTGRSRSIIKPVLYVAGTGVALYGLYEAAKYFKLYDRIFSK